MRDLVPAVVSSDSRSRASTLKWALQGFVEVILLALAFPVVILCLGSPVALLIRVIIEIAQKF
jgi:hypothetical protein